MKINFVSWLSDELGRNFEIIDLVKDISVSELFSLLESKSATPFKYIFQDQEIVRASVNGKVVDGSKMITNNCEVTLFAPMSGG